MAPRRPRRPIHTCFHVSRKPREADSYVFYRAGEPPGGPRRFQDGPKKAPGGFQEASRGQFIPLIALSLVVLAFGFAVLGFSSVALGFGIVAPGSWALAPGSWALAPRSWALPPGSWPSAPGLLFCSGVIPKSNSYLKSCYKRPKRKTAQPL